jgi:hypothetical protein
MGGGRMARRGGRGNSPSPGSVCVFCGQRAKDKTKEHILPQWLLEMTNTTAANMTYGIYRGQRFFGLTMRACDPCNSAYSDLEGRTKPVVEKLLSVQAITAIEADTVLDWLDKVRIGLWILDLTRSGNPLQIVPRFRISNRMSRKDRVLRVSYFNHQRKALSYFGTPNLAFHFSPSCFGLAINDLMLFNFSFDFATSKPLGLGYIINAADSKDGRDFFVGQFVAGDGTTSEPVWKNLLLGSGNYFLQSIRYVIDENGNAVPSGEDDRLFSADAIDVGSGKGAIFSSKNLAEFHRHRPTDIAELREGVRVFHERAFSSANLDVLRIQKYICTSGYPHKNFESPFDRRILALRELDELIRDSETDFWADLGLIAPRQGSFVIPRTR